ncbi:MAG: hypothetical protein KF901_22590 [Myxococcales bacterium]|nr:hypothetical protein [Myxococcales bacterium]
MRWALLALVLLVGGVGFAFYRHQNRARAGALGGRISRAKAAWLTFAVLFWLGVCPLLALEPSLPTRWRVVLGVFAAQFWLRGLVELYLLYVTKSWRPPYGIAHDLFSLALVLALVALPGGFPLEPAHLVGLAASTLVALSLVAETYYAWVFFQLVEGKTTGDEGVWFADQEDPRFVRVNRLTAALNVPLYVGLGALVAVAFGGV